MQESRSKRGFILRDMLRPHADKTAATEKDPESHSQHDGFGAQLVVIQTGLVQQMHYVQVASLMA